MSFEWVEDSLSSQLLAGMGQYAKDIAWKNLPFEPGDRSLWLKSSIVPAQEGVATLGKHGENEYLGFLQIGIYQRINEGTAQSAEVRNLINRLFPVPGRLQAPEGCMLRVERKTFSSGGQTSMADLSAGGTEVVWDANYITIYWLAREPR